MCLGEIGVVTKVWSDDGVPLALVEVESTIETVCLLVNPEVGEGANVLIHMGFVVEVLDPDAAEDAKHLRRGS